MAPTDYDEYFTSSRDTYRLVRVKREWVPGWLWRCVELVDPQGVWLAHWLTVKAG